MTMTLQASIIAPAAAEKMAASENPWIYLAGILLVAFGVIFKKFYDDFKKDKEAAAEAAAEREDRLIAIEEERRKESIDRELRLTDQLKLTTERFSEITSVVNKISESQDQMLESIRYLNTDMRDIKERQDRLERMGQLKQIQTNEERMGQ